MVAYNLLIGEYYPIRAYMTSHTNTEVNREENHELRFEYTQITPNIYIGTTMCCQAHFDAELIKKGITVDISLQGEDVDTPFGVEEFVWIPVKNNTPPTPDQITMGVSVINNAIRLGKKIYVHCRFGHGRGPTMVAAYLVSLGKTAEDAVAFIASKRNAVHLTDSQMAALKQFEARIAREKTPSER